LQAAKAQAQTKACKRACKANPRQNCFKKFPTLQKKIKNPTHSRHSMTQKLNTDNGFQGRRSRTTGYNTGLAKVTVQCSADTFTHCKIVFYGIREPFGVVVNETLVLPINI